MSNVLPADSQIDRVRNWAGEHEDAGTSAFPGMTYEQGVKETLEWLLDGANAPDGNEDD